MLPRRVDACAAPMANPSFLAVEGARPGVQLPARRHDRKTDAERSAVCRDARGCGTAAHAFPSLPYAYVIDELDSTVTTYRSDSGQESLQPVQVVPTTPPSFAGNNTGAGVAVAPVRTLRLRLQSRARQHRDLRRRSCPREFDAGRLEPTQGKTPRFLILDPEADFLNAAKPGYRHDRRLPRGPDDWPADPDRSDRRDRQPGPHYHRRRLDLVANRLWLILVPRACTELFTLSISMANLPKD